MNRFLDKIVFLCTEHNVVTSEQTPWLRYALEKRISTIIVSVPFYFISYLLSSFETATSFFLVFYALRARTNGYHAKSVMGCLTTSIILSFLFLGMINSLLTTWISSFFVGFGGLVIYRWAPFDHPKMQLTKEELHASTVSGRYRLLISVLLYCVFCGLDFLKIAYGISLAILLTAVLLLAAYFAEGISKRIGGGVIT